MTRRLGEREREREREREKQVKENVRVSIKINAMSWRWKCFPSNIHWKLENPNYSSSRGSLENLSRAIKESNLATIIIQKRCKRSQQRNDYDFCQSFYLFLPRRSFLIFSMEDLASLEPAKTRSIITWRRKTQAAKTKLTQIKQNIVVIMVDYLMENIGETEHERLKQKETMYTK